MITLLLENGADADQKNHADHAPFSLITVCSTEMERKEVRNISVSYLSHVLKKLGVFEQGSILISDYMSREETECERLQRGYEMNQLSIEEAKDYDRGKYSRP